APRPRGREWDVDGPRTARESRHNESAFLSVPHHLFPAIPRRCPAAPQGRSGADLRALAGVHFRRYGRPVSRRWPFRVRSSRASACKNDGIFAPGWCRKTMARLEDTHYDTVRFLHPAVRGFFPLLPYIPESDMRPKRLTPPVRRTARRWRTPPAITH